MRESVQYGSVSHEVKQPTRGTVRHVFSSRAGGRNSVQNCDPGEMPHCCSSILGWFGRIMTFRTRTECKLCELSHI